MSTPTEPTMAHSPGLPTVDVLGVPVARITRDTALTVITGFLDRAEPALIAFASAHSINVAFRHPEYRETLRAADLVLNDGIGLNLVARLNGTRFRDNLNGTDLTPQILARLARFNVSVFLLGARPGVADRASQRLMEMVPGLRIAGTADGFTLRESDAAAKVKASGADVLLVAMGNPLQELWLRRNLAASGARIGIGVGGFFDFTSGRKSRAPRWARRLSLEWLYRLCLEPRRLFVRYVLGNPLFVLRALRARFWHRR